jgi:hypothetical protein
VQGIAVADDSLDMIAAALARLSAGDLLRFKVLRAGKVLDDARFRSGMTRPARG